MGADERPRAGPGLSLAVAQVLLRTDHEVHATARGGSMGRTIPDGAMIRIVPCDPATCGRGMVVAVMHAEGLVTHRIVARGRGADAYVVTRGDARTVCDAPVPVRGILGEVTAYRDTAQWRAPGPAPVVPGWRGLAARLLDGVMRLALVIDPRLASIVAASARRAAGVRRRLAARPRHGAVGR